VNTSTSIQLRAGTEARDLHNRKVKVPADMLGQVISRDAEFVVARTTDGNIYAVPVPAPVEVRPPPPLPVRRKPKTRKAKWLEMHPRLARVLIYVALADLILSAFLWTALGVVTALRLLGLAWWLN